MKRLPIGVMVPTLVVGIMALFMVLPEFFVSLKKPVDFNELTDAELKSGLHVEGDVCVILDTFATEETYTENKDGSRTPSKVSGYYYIIPVGDSSYIGIEGSVDNRSTFQKIDDSTWAVLTGAAADLDPNAYYHYEGYIDDMDDELYGYLVDWFMDETTTEDEVKTYALPLMIKPMSPGLMPLLIIGVAMLALNVLFVVLHLNYKKKAKAAAVSTDEPWAPPASSGSTYSAPDAGYTAPDPAPPAAPKSSVTGDPWDAPDKQ